MTVGTMARYPGLGWPETLRYAAAPVGAALMIAQLVLGGTARLAGVRGADRAPEAPSGL